MMVAFFLAVNKSQESYEPKTTFTVTHFDSQPSIDDRDSEVDKSLGLDKPLNGNFHSDRKW